jgi:LytS/YehU family sensor histidine kinase
MLFYYPFVYGVLPRIFYQKKVVSGIAMTVALVVIYALAETLREGFLLKDCAPCMESLKATNNGYYGFLHAPLHNRLFAKLASFGSLIGLLFSLALPLSIKLGLQALRQQFRSLRLAKENLQLEFNFLRSQINPHFLFNTLNNIYGLILNDRKEKSAEVVAKLSHFLRYTLYESNSDAVPVEKEVQLLKDYIGLESIRLNCTQVHFTHHTDHSVATMPPLLMIPVVENAFKYSADRQDGYIIIDFAIKDKTCSFQLKNSVDPDRQPTTAGGIGLRNFGKRLQLYYPNRHQCEVSASEREYAVSVNIDCHGA